MRRYSFRYAYLHPPPQAMGPTQSNALTTSALKQKTRLGNQNTGVRATRICSQRKQPPRLSSRKPNNNTGELDDFAAAGAAHPTPRLRLYDNYKSG